VAPSRSARSGRRRSARSPTRSPMGVGMRVRSRPAPVVVAVTPVPVRAPDRVPEIARAPLRERPRLSLSLGGSAQTCQSQTGGDHDSCCGEACEIFHVAFLTNQAMREIRKPKSHLCFGASTATETFA
jgi:hypothetical protein